jgi:hypothetical protein
VDPLNALATFVLGRMKQTAIGAAVKFFAALVVSAIGTFLLVFGAVLAGPKAVTLIFQVDPFAGLPGGDWAVAVGLGSLCSGVVMIVAIRSSPYAKGMKFVFPSWEALAEINTGTETIEPTQEKKS